MIEKCWAQLNAESLAYFGICDCQSECARKAKLVDLLAEVLEHDGLEVAEAVARLNSRSMPWFRSN
jgi:hypothetical protein